MLQVAIPVNSRAKVSVPKIGLENFTVSEGGKPIWMDGSYVGGVTGITDGSESTDYVTFDVGSDSYSFKLSILNPHQALKSSLSTIPSPEKMSLKASSAPWQRFLNEM